MSINEQIANIWQSSEARSLGDALYEVLGLIQQAYAQQEPLDLSLELDIILMANYAQSYGEKFEQVLQILKLWKKAYNVATELNATDPLLPKILRLNAIVNHLIVSTLSASPIEQQQLIETGVAHLAVDSFATLLQKLIIHTTQLLAYHVASDWSYDNISSLITLTALCNTAYQTTIQLPDLSFYFDTSNEELQPFIQQWTNSLIPNSDQFRFMYMLAFNTSVAEDYWLNLAQQLLTGE